MEVEFTWNWYAGGCGVIQSCKDHNCDGTHSIGVTFITSYIFVLTAMSVLGTGFLYFLLRKESKLSVNYLKENAAKCGKALENISTKIDEREAKMTRTIIILVGVHVFCNLPMVLMQMTSFPEASSTFGMGENLSMILWHIVMIIWISQFVLNFFIYARSNEQYQKAYYDLWKIILNKISIHSNVI